MGCPLLKVYRQSYPLAQLRIRLVIRLPDDNPEGRLKAPCRVRMHQHALEADVDRSPGHGEGYGYDGERLSKESAKSSGGDHEAIPCFFSTR